MWLSTWGTIRSTLYLKSAVVLPGLHSGWLLVASCSALLANKTFPGAVSRSASQCYGERLLWIALRPAPVLVRSVCQPLCFSQTCLYMNVVEAMLTQKNCVWNAIFINRHGFYCVGKNFSATQLLLYQLWMRFSRQWGGSCYRYRWVVKIHPLIRSGSG